MLSYLHGFHAGNHADVLKHSILSLVLLRLVQKDRPLTYMDSHAGAGFYDLSGTRAVKTGEAQSGVFKLFGRQDVPELLVPYVTLCDRLYKQGNCYPGSPAIAAAFTRSSDNIILMELHPTEYTNLKQEMSLDKRVHVHRRDGFSALVALTPPVHRRGVVLIDPSYETDEEYLNVAKAVSALVKRWSEAVVVIWYPLVQRRAAETAILKQAIVSNAKHRVLCSEFCPGGLGDNEWGLYGSGVLIVNPPWKIEEEIDGCLPWISNTLASTSQVTAKQQWLS